MDHGVDKYLRESAWLSVQLASSRDLLQLTRPLHTRDLSMQTPSPQLCSDVTSQPRDPTVEIHFLQAVSCNQCRGCRPSVVCPSVTDVLCLTGRA